MQKTQEHGDVNTSVEKPMVESVSLGNQRVFTAFEKASLKTQLLLISFTAAAICIVAVVVSQILIHHTSPHSFSWLQIGLSALIAGVTVGVTTFAIGQLIINSINSNLDNLKSQFEAVVQGDFTVKSPVNCSPEFSQLSISFNQMTQGIHRKFKEAQQKAKVQEKENEDLQQKLMQIIHNLDLTFDNDSNLETTVVTPEDYETPDNPPGSLLEFLDNFHKWSQLPTAPELLLGSSTLEEIQQRKDQLQYRQVWLQAIMEETEREIKLISPIAQLGDKNNVKEINED